jgi:hypothetical protein
MSFYLISVLWALENLPEARIPGLYFPLEPRLDTSAEFQQFCQVRSAVLILKADLQCRLCSLVLREEVVQVWHKVLDDVHVGEGADFDHLARALDVGDAGQGVHPTCRGKFPHFIKETITTKYNYLNAKSYTGLGQQVKSIIFNSLPNLSFNWEGGG